MREELPGFMQGQQMNFADLVKILKLYAWKIIGLTGVVVVLTMLYAYTRIPLYKSATTLLIEPKLNKAVQIREVYDPGIGTDEYFATQIEILRSSQLAEKVVQRLKLDQAPLPDASAEQPLVKIDWRSIVRQLPPGPWHALAPEPLEPAPPPTAEKLSERAVKVLRRNLVVEPVPRTQLLRVSYVSSSADHSAAIANAYAEAYLDYGLESRLEASKRATRWLTEKLSELRTTLEQAEKNLQAFRDREQLVNVGGARTLVEEEVVDTTRRLREAQKTRAELAATYAKIQQAGRDTARLEEISDLLNLNLVQSAKSNLVAAQENLKQLQQRYGERHPQIVGATTRLQTAEKTFKDQLLLAAQNFRNQYELSQDSERRLGGSVEAARERIRALDRKQYELGVLQREVSSNEQLYNLFLSSFKEADTSSTYEPINARIIEVARPADGSFYPDFYQLALKSLAGGLLLSLLLVATRQMLDESVRSAEELELVSDLTVMGVLPSVSTLGRRRSMLQLYCADSRTPFAEGIRSVRASLQLSDVDKRYRRIMITSTVPGEGKSSLASCLAAAFAAAERTVLIEGDLRAPSLKKMFGIPKTRPGLIEVLTGECKLEDAMFVHEDSKVHVLTVARRPPNPAEVVNSAAFAQLLHDLSASYDRILIDSPPCQAASDALILARLADTVVFTVKADETRRRAVTNAIKQLRNVRAAPLGAVINQVNARRNPNYTDSYYAKGYYG